MKKIIIFVVILVSIYSLTFGQNNTKTTGNSYFVKANGNDQNNGLSENTAFKTLKKAVFVVTKNNTIKTITIVGTLDPISEEYTDPKTTTEILEKSIPINGVFTIGDDVDIKIIGKDQTSTLSGGNKKNVVVLVVGFKAKIILENINIENGGCGLALYGGTVNIGDGVKIRNNSNITRELFVYSVSGHNTIENSGGGIIVTNAGNLKFDGIGWFVEKNDAFLGAGLYIHNGSVLIARDGGMFMENHAIYGGAVYIDRVGTFTMRGGLFNNNIADEFGGNVFIRGNGRFIKEPSTTIVEIHRRNVQIYVGDRSAKEGYAVYVSRGETIFKRDTVIYYEDSFDSEKGPWE